MFKEEEDVSGGELENLVLAVAYDPVRREHLNLYFGVPFLITRKGPVIFRRLRLQRREKQLIYS